MPQRSRPGGPLTGHWFESLGLIEVVEDVKAFVCQKCTASGQNQERSTIRSASNASNFYTHFKLVHSETHSILQPLIQARIKNKRTRVEHMTIADSMSRSRQKLTSDFLVQMFSSPDIPK